MKLAIGILITLWVGAMHAQPTSGALSGKVLDAKGQPFPRAQVSATLMADDPLRYTPWQGNAESGADGSYRITGAPAGRYEVCVWTPRPEFVNRCMWGRAVAVVTIAQGGEVTQEIRLEEGRELRIRVEDPEGFLDRHEGKTPGARLEVGVYTAERMYLTAEPVGQQRAGMKIYRVTVPVEDTWRLRVGGPFYTVEGDNERQQPLNVLMELDQRVRANEKDKEMVVRLRGLRAAEGEVR